MHLVAHFPLLQISPQEQSLFDEHFVMQYPESKSQGHEPSHLRIGLAQFIKAFPMNPEGQPQFTLWLMTLHSAQVPQTEVVLQGPYNNKQNDEFNLKLFHTY